MGTDLKKFVEERLQLVRMERRLTQEQMSEKLNISTSAYCKIEYGETDLTLTRLNKIAEILDMPATELFQRISGDTYENTQRDYGQMSFARDHGNTGNHITVEVNSDLRELVKSNTRLIEMLMRRIDELEKK